MERFNYGKLTSCCTCSCFSLCLFGLFVEQTHVTLTQWRCTPKFGLAPFLYFYSVGGRSWGQLQTSICGSQSPPSPICPTSTTIFHIKEFAWRQDMALQYSCMMFTQLTNTLFNSRALDLMQNYLRYPTKSLKDIKILDHLLQTQKEICFAHVQTSSSRLVVLNHLSTQRSLLGHNSIVIC